jgi:MoxR-like ATPase
MSEFSGGMQSVEKLQAAYAGLRTEMGRVIIGQDLVIEQLMIALLGRGHCLLQGVPGLAKTLMISTFAKVLDVQFNRIQFTPDLMPGDITGTEIISGGQGSDERGFHFFHGPVFSNVVLADEINRTPPKTQSALLQAMQEHCVTISGKTYKLPEPFFVLATQNPIEQEGTYPLPEAQLDRFMFMLLVDYPNFEEECEIVRKTTSDLNPEPSVVLTGEDLLALQDFVRTVPISDELIKKAVRLATQTRPQSPGSMDYIKKHVTWGAGPRAGQHLVTGAKCRAILHGRPTPNEDDLRAVAAPVLRHRVLTSFAAEAAGVRSEDVIQHLLEEL